MDGVFCAIGLSYVYIKLDCRLSLIMCNLLTLGLFFVNSCDCSSKSLSNPLHAKDGSKPFRPVHDRSET